ncbi:hypothetical protein, partial [Flavobacterium taihuense]
CGTPSGTITVVSQTGMEYSLDGTTYQSSNVFAGLVPNNYTLSVRNVLDATCLAVSGTATKINAVPTAPVVPTALSVVQPTCGIPSGTITVVSQTGMEYSLDGATYQSSNVFAGLVPNNYTLSVRNVLDASCSAVSGTTTKINSVPTAPVVPTALSVVQPTCGTPSGTITVVSQTGMEYSLDGTTYQSSNVFAGLVPNNYTLSVRNVLDATCLAVSGTTTKINAVPTAPVVPTALSVVQPTCGTPSGTITVVSQTGMEYSLDGTTYQSSNVFAGLVPNNYTLSVRNVLDATCLAVSGTATKINAVPTAPVVPTALSVVQPTCGTPSGTITVVSQTGMEYSLDGTTYQSSNVFAGLVPNNYTLSVRNVLDASCSAVSGTTTKINAVPTAPVVPTALSVVQPTCGTPSGTITVVSQTGMEYSLDGTIYQSSNVFAGLVPNNYTLSVRNVLDASCSAVSGTTTKINVVPTAPVVPTALSVVQPTCGTPSGTITVVSQTGMEYSLDGTTYQSSNVFAGLVPNNYTLSVRNVLDASCLAVSGTATKINAVPTAPVVPTALSVVQPTCGIPSGTITVVSQTGMEYSLDGTIYQSSNVFAGLVPNNYTLSVRNVLDASCLAVSGTATKINAVPTAPVVPTALSVVQPTCGIPSGTITVVSQTGMEYSLDGTSYQSSNVFAGLVPNNYTLS